MDPAARWLVTNRRNGDGKDAVPCQPPRQAAQGAGERPIGTYNRFTEPDFFTEKCKKIHF